MRGVADLVEQAGGDLDGGRVAGVGQGEQPGAPTSSCCAGSSAAASAARPYHRMASSRRPSNRASLPQIVATSGGSRRPPARPRPGPAAPARRSRRRRRPSTRRRRRRPTRASARAAIARVGLGHPVRPSQDVRAQPQEPVVQQRRHQPAREVDLPAVEQPAQGGAQLRERGIDLGDGRAQPGSISRRSARSIHVDLVAGVPLADLLGPAGVGELLGAERPQRLQQDVPAVRRAEDQRAFGELGQVGGGRPRRRRRRRPHPRP